MPHVIETEGVIIFGAHEWSVDVGDLPRLILDARDAGMGVDLAIEIGSGPGVRARAIAPFFKHVYSIDPWIPGYDPSDQSADVERMRSARAVWDSLRPGFPNVTQLCDFSVSIAASFPFAACDFVYIDGCHTFDAVCADIQAWRLRIRAGGCMAGHDFTPAFPGVQRAVRLLLGEPVYYSGGHWRCQLQPTS